MRNHGQKPERHARGDSRALWLYGLHAVRAALANPKRKVKRAVVTERARDELGRELGGVPAETASPEAVARLLPPGSVPKDLDIAIKRLEAGEDPEKIEQDMGDLLGGGEEGGGGGTGGGGYSRDSGLYDY